MPQVIGALIIEAVDYVASAAIATTASFEIAGVSISYATLIGTTVIAAASLAISAALLPSTPSVDGGVTLQQPIPFRRRVYGHAKMGGYFVFWTSENGKLFMLLALCSHEAHSYDEYWVGDRQVGINSDGWVAQVLAPPGANVEQFNPGGGFRVRIIGDLGTPSKTYNTVLAAAFPTLWTSACIGVGIADVMLEQDAVSSSNFGTVYPGGQQTIRILGKWAKVYDPRVSDQVEDDPTTWEWTDNAACVLLDYLTHADGWRIDKSVFLTGMGGTATINAMQICDQAVPLSSGGTETRYRIWGFYDFNEEPRAVLARMLAACGGWLQPYPDGTVGLQMGVWTDPTFTITDDMILGFEIQNFVGEFDAINEIRATFLDPDNDYQGTESTPWDDDADIARRGYIKATSVDARHCPSFTQTRRIQKIALYEASPEYSYTLTLSAAALAGRNQRFVNLIIDQLGLSDTCRVTSFVVDLQTCICTVGLASFSAAAYAWDPDTEEGPPPPIPPDSSSAGTVETPTGLTVTVVTRGNQPAMQMSCNAPVFRTDLDVTFEYEIHNSGNWTIVSSGNQNTSTETGALGADAYDVRVSFVAPNGVRSEYEEVDDVMVSASETAPGSPTNLAAYVTSPSIAHITFNAPNSPTYYDSRVYRNSTNVFSGATDVSGPIYGSPNQAHAFQESPGSGTWYYWATAESQSGNASLPTGPVTVTI